eukprot:scpid27034/ scgid4205/ Centrosomal protein of 135 kDa; Centrosomal protein 4
MATATERSFLQLRKRLDQLGYRQPLPIESLPLVERLFDDLVQTTDSLRKARSELGEKQLVVEEAHDYIEPYQNENARLVTENRELHLRLIKQKDECTAHTREYKANLRRLEHQNSDLTFLNTQYVVRIKALEKEVRDRNDRIQQLQEKNLQAVIQTPGGRKKTIAFRRQRMEIDCPVPPSDAAGKASPAKLQRDPYVADLLRVADARITGLTEELQKAKENCNTSERRAGILAEQVESRDTEIERLGGLLEHGRPHELILAEGKRNLDERLVAQMTMQMEILTDQRHQLETKLTDSEAQMRAEAQRAEELQSKNLQLCEELRAIQSLSRDLQHEADHMRTQHGQVETSVQQLHTELHEGRTSLLSKENELQRAVTDIKCLQELLETSQADAKRTTHVLEQMDREKRVLEQKCSQLLATEHALNVELESLRKLATLHEEGRAQRSSAEHRRVGAALDDLSVTADARRAQVENLQHELQSMQHQCTHLQEERDHFRNELDLLMRRNSSTRDPGVGRERSPRNSTVADLSAIERDNRQLQKVLQRFEGQLGEIQRDLKAVKEERDSLSLLYRQACQQIDELRRHSADVDDHAAAHQRTDSPSTKAHVPASTLDATTAQHYSSPRAEPGGKAQGSSPRELQALREERDSLTARIGSLRAMVASLEDQVKASSAATNNAVSEQKQAQAVAEEMRRLSERTRERIKFLEEDIQRSTAQCASLKAQLLSMQGQSSTSSGVVNTLRTELRTIEEERDGLLQKVRELQAIVGRSRDEQDAIVRQVSDKQQLMEEQQATVEQLQRNLRDQTHGHSVQSQKLEEMRNALREVDAERDQLHAKIERQNEEFQRAMKLHSTKAAEAETLQSRLQQAGQQVRHGDDRCSELQRQLQHLQQQLEKQELRQQQCVQQRDAETVRVQQLMNEQIASKQAIDALKTELSQAIASREELKASIQQYTGRLLEFEQALEAKEREKGELLESFHRLSEEHSSLDESARTFQEETSHVRVEYGKFLQEHKMLQETLRHQAHDIRQLQDEKGEYETRVADLRKKIDALQAQLQQTQDSLHASISERTSARDLCVRLDQAQDALQQRVTAMSRESEHLTAQLGAERSERQAIENQFDAERVSVKNLESLIAMERVEVSQQHSHTDRLQLDNQKLSDRVKEMQAKLQEGEKDLALWREQTRTLSAQVADLKRQLTNERYEKEWTIQQMQSASAPTTTDTEQEDNAAKPRRSPRAKKQQQQQDQGTHDDS